LVVAVSRQFATIEDRFDEMAKGTFGERLKRERELREVPLNEIATATRIAPKFLEALENEQWQKLPGGIFGRGFVRSIARYLGLSEEDLLSEYDLARGETSAALQHKPEERIPAPPKWVPVLAVLLLLGLLTGIVVGGRYAWRSYMAHRAAKKASAIVNVPLKGAAPGVTPTAAPGFPPASSKASAPLDLSVAALTATHVRVVADGTLAFDAELSVGQILHFSANDKFQVSAADFAALLLELNGRALPPLGKPPSSGTILLTSKDLRPINSGIIQP
jgi:cytoskeleton protein RodZ